jgi:hypothetical protein
VYLYDTASALTDIGVDYLLTLSLKNIIIIYTMAQRKNPAKQKKKQEGRGERAEAEEADAEDNNQSGRGTGEWRWWRRGVNPLSRSIRRGLCMTRATNDAGGVKP